MILYWPATTLATSIEDVVAYWRFLEYLLVTYSRRCLGTRYRYLLKYLGKDLK